MSITLLLFSCADTATTNQDVEIQYTKGEDGLYHFSTGEKGKGELIYEQKIGEWTFWDSQNNLKNKGTFKYDKREGLWEYWYPSGAKLSEGKYKYDKRNGFWQFWYQNGQPMEMRNYTNNQNILLSAWSSTGKPLVVDGNGLYEYYHEDILREKGYYKNGLPDSTWTIWNENGEKIESFTIRNGKKLKDNLYEELLKPSKEYYNK
ncbi:MAG: toxin-antitoxin system YwqK family antitoxin [Chitinophagales bacterium]